MTPRQKELVKSSFAAVEPIADVAASIFYDRLFASTPRSGACSRRPTWPPSART